MYRRAAEQAKAIAASFQREATRSRAQRFTSDFCITVDGKPAYAEKDGKLVAPETFPRRLR